MNRVHRLTIAALVAGAALMMAGAAWAQDPPAGDPSVAHPGEGMSRGPGRGGHRAMMEKLNLTDDQSKKLEDIRYQHQKKAITMRADLESARLDLGRMMRADQPDRRAIEAQLDKISQARLVLAKDRVGQMLDMRAVLTPEQLKTWREMRGGMRGGMHGGMPRMMHGGAPGMWHDGPGGMSGPGGGGSGDSMMMGDPGMGDPGDDLDPGPEDGVPGH
jgi:Spy/CpxP family protein refolding chaperone